MFIAPPPLEPTTIHAPCIVEFENAFLNTSKIIKNIEEVTNNPSSGVAFQQAVVNRLGKIGLDSERTNSQLSINVAAERNEFFRELNNQFFLTTLAATRWYTEYFGIKESIEQVEPYQLLRYQTGEEYKAHYDGASKHNRAVSPILYLNNDYEGGFIEFVNFNLKVKPKAGSLFLFTSTYPYSHIAHPVTGGTKYAIVSFFHDVIYDS
jgi:predicted 2-oxoglutarate/Fe(II)-dependent dioxygenase YbiX